VTRRLIVPFLLLASLLVAAAGVFARAAVVPPDAARLGADVETLAAPEMEGRRSGTAGGDRAARQIADWFGAAGLRPGGDEGSYLQTFVLETITRPSAGSSLELTAPSSRRFESGRDWSPHGGSLAGEASGDVVFVGYGADLPEAGYDDYASVDVRGKIALALEGAPPHLAGTRVSRLDKLIAAKRRGAAALLIAGDELPTPAATTVQVGLVSGALTRPAADVLLAPSGRTTAAAVKQLVATRAPASLATGARITIRVEMVAEQIRAANVVGVLAGTDPARAGEAIVIGAHYDHLGRVDGVVHPGADDNASGSAVVLALARAFGAAGGAERTLVFVLFGAEELGLLGSRHYVSHPLIPLTKTVAMLNFDMVGRMQGTRVNIAGGDSGSGLRAMAGEAAQKEGVTAELLGNPHGPSDHSRFYDAGVPVLFFYTGGHGDYHRPTDTADKINAAGMARLAALAVRIVEQLASDGAPPVYAQVPRPAGRRTTSGATPGAAPGGAFLGVAAPPRSGSDGLRLASVVPGTAAEQAGLREGDVIVRIAGTLIDGLEDVRTLLRERRPGDTVGVLYLRDGEAHATMATLGARAD
jgi:aminopeptidase YwaD